MAATNPLQTSTLADINRRQQMAQALMGQFTNRQGATPFASLMNVASAMMAMKQAKDVGQEKSDYIQQQQQTRNKDIASALSAYRGDTPYQADTFGPEDQLPPGLMNRGNQQNTDALIQSLMSSQSPDLQAAALKALVPSTASGGTPYFNFIPTSTGYVVGDARTGDARRMTLEGSNIIPPTSISGQPTQYPPAPQAAPPKPILPIAADPIVKGDVAETVAEKTEIGKARGKALANLPKALSNIEQTINLVDKIIADPALESISGLGSGQITKHVYGTEAAAVQAMVDQLQGKVFLDAYETLKGGGQITEIEGKKAEASRTIALNPKLSYSVRLAAFKDYRDSLAKGAERARIEAGQPGQDASPVQPGVINTQEEYDALPSGAEYIDPDDGKRYRKP